MNALDRRINSTMDKLISKYPITSEICYFKGLLDDQFSDFIRTNHDEQQMKIKIIILNEDMKKYMKNSYTSLSLPYNKENERHPFQKPSVRFEDNEDDNDQSSDASDNDPHEPDVGCKCILEEFCGDDIDLSIEMLLNNSENFGERRYDVPDLPNDLTKNKEFVKIYYSDFYSRLLTLFEDFCDYKINSQIYMNEEIIFAKLICRDQLFVLKINTFDAFYKKSIKYLKTGKGVFIKATCYHINNVLIRLRYDETLSVLHDLNPYNQMTYEWSKDYFDINENVEIDYSDFGLDFYEEDDEDWLSLEKNIDSIIKNFEKYIALKSELLFAEFTIKLIRDNYLTIDKTFGKIRKNIYSCSFKINITDLILLVLELKQLPQQENIKEEKKTPDLSEGLLTLKSSEVELGLNRFASEKAPNIHNQKYRISPSLFADKFADNSYTEDKRQQTILDYEEADRKFTQILFKDYDINKEGNLYFYNHTEESPSNGKSRGKEKLDAFADSLKDLQPYLSEDALLFYSIEVNYTDKTILKKKSICTYKNIFDRKLINECIDSVGNIKEQLYQKSRVNRSDTHIDTGFGHLDQFETQNESFDSYNENKQNEEEEEYEDFSEANIII